MLRRAGRNRISISACSSVWGMRSWRRVVPTGQNYCGRLFLLLHEAKIVDPELTTYGISRRQPAQMEQDQLSIRTGGEISIDRLPERRILQLITFIENVFTVNVLNREVRAAGAFEFGGFIEAGEIIFCARFDDDGFIDARIVNARAMKRDRQGTWSGVIFAGVECERDGIDFVVLPVEAPV